MKSKLQDLGHPGAGRDPNTIRRYQRMVELYTAYYRPEVRGFENLPAQGPFLVVGNHSGGATPPDMPILMSAWWRQRSIEEPVYGLFHSTFLAIPGVRAPLTKFGAIEAGWDAAEAILDEGGIVLVYPGGDHEVFRPYNVRNKIDFAGRKGFIRLALRAGVPIVPSVTIGVQDSVIIVSRGESLLKFMPWMKNWRVKVMPVMVGLPWGVSFGLPTIPLPSKATVQLGTPIDLSAQFGPEAANDERVLERCYDQITGTMQGMLDELVAERGSAPWPLSTLKKLV
jgi:1-acyl-sn-glycerol-3-phosphate acyltransferase